MAQLDAYNWLLDPTRDEDVPHTDLTLRERQVLVLASRGYSRLDTAEAMNLGLETVKSYRKGSLLKLDARNMAHAVAEAFRRGILI